MATIFEELRKDHDKQRTLVDLVVKTKGDSEGRRELLDNLRKALRSHESAEEKHFYVPLMKADLTQEKARHSIAEHHEMDELLDELEQTDFSSSGWLATAEKLRERVLHHLDEEENEVFQMAGKVLTEEQKSKLGTSYRDAMDES